MRSRSAHVRAAGLNSPSVLPIVRACSPRQPRPRSRAPSISAFFGAIACCESDSSCWPFSAFLSHPSGHLLIVLVSGLGAGVGLPPSCLEIIPPPASKTTDRTHFRAIGGWFHALRRPNLDRLAAPLEVRDRLGAIGQRFVPLLYPMPVNRFRFKRGRILVLSERHLLRGPLRPSD